MRFLLDESVDFPLAAVLAQLGHDVTTIGRDHPQSLNDEDVLQIATRESRILLTNDRDFGELIFLRRLPHAGVILFRLGKEDMATKAAWLTYVLDTHASSLDQFILVTDHGIRIRATR